MTTEEMKNEFYGLIWKTATNLVHGGKVSPVQFMDYMLGALFYRFISENITDHFNQMLLEFGETEADYASMSDEEAEGGREQAINDKGFFILPSQLFINVANNARHNEELNTTLAIIFRQIEESAKGAASEEDMKGLFDNFNTNDNGLGGTVAERNELLTTLLESVRDLNFAKYAESGIDVFGLCYEHLIKMYALNSGTKGGEFYTPSEVSYLLAMIAAAGRKRVNKVYDPACGSGSLLLNFNRVLGAENVEEGYFGQEINLKTYNLCRMNMFLHNINYSHFDIKQGDTLTRPMHDHEEPFDAIVSNPPYSVPWAGDSDPTLINDPRFAPAAVLAPRSKADLAFTMHMLAWLSPIGTAAIVEFPGVLYRGGAEQKIRQYLVRENFVDTVIQLPPNLFFGTSITTCIIVLKKNKADNRICFIDASKEFVHEGNKNKLSEENIKRIYETHRNKAEIAHFSHVVTIADVEAQDFNLSVSTYVEPEDTREVIDINELNAQIAEIVERENVLRSEIDEIIKDIERRSINILTQLCPEGVGYVKIGEVCEMQRGSTITKKEIIEGDIPVIAGGQKPAYYCNKYNRTGETITVAGSGAYAGYVAYWNENIFVSDAFSIKGIEGVSHTKYLYYVLKNLQERIYATKQGAGIPHVHISNIDKWEIPLPSLQIQSEIISILDKYTVFGTDLEIKLKAALDYHKQQYEYYRNKLLTFNRKAV